jgi:hypothetical protein
MGTSPMLAGPAAHQAQPSTFGSVVSPAPPVEVKPSALGSPQPGRGIDDGLRAASSMATMDAVALPLTTPRGRP